MSHAGRDAEFISDHQASDMESRLPQPTGSHFSMFTRDTDTPHCLVSRRLLRFHSFILCLFVTNIPYFYSCCAVRSASTVNLNKMAWIGSRRRVTLLVVSSSSCCFTEDVSRVGSPTVWHRTCAYTLSEECGHMRPQATFGCGLSDGIANASSVRLDYTCT